MTADSLDSLRRENEQLHKLCDTQADHIKTLQEQLRLAHLRTIVDAPAKADMTAEVIRKVVEPMIDKALDYFYAELALRVNGGLIDIVRDEGALHVTCSAIVRAALADGAK